MFHRPTGSPLASAVAPPVWAGGDHTAPRHSTSPRRGDGRRSPRFYVRPPSLLSCPQGALRDAGRYDPGRWTFCARPRHTAPSGVGTGCPCACALVVACLPSRCCQGTLQPRTRDDSPSPSDAYPSPSLPGSPASWSSRRLGYWRAAPAGAPRGR